MPLKGYKQTEEHKRKNHVAGLSSNAKGKTWKVDPEKVKDYSQRAKNNGVGKWMKGRHLSKETKEKISESKKGSKAYQWKGGISKYKKTYSILRKQREKEAPGSHTLEEWETLKAQYNWTCPCCKKQEPKIIITKDHIIPLIKGGSHNIENIQPLCKQCNSRKHSKIIKY